MPSIVTTILTWHGRVYCSKSPRMIFLPSFIIKPALIIQQVKLSARTCESRECVNVTRDGKRQTHRCRVSEPESEREQERLQERRRAREPGRATAQERERDTYLSI